MDGNFEHRMTKASNSELPKGLGANSAFALGGATTPAGASAPAAKKSGKPVKVRDGSMRHQLLQALEGCNQLNTDGIADKLGITLKQAADLANQMTTKGLLQAVVEDGRKQYRIKLSGFKQWLTKKAPTDVPMAKPAAKNAMASGAPAAHAINANSVQHGGSHYKALPIQPWDFIVSNSIGFLEGNAIKYLTRWREKGGVEDLHKAQHYIQKLIETETSKGTTV